ncbi:hypothetical protein GQ457_01G012630 [Hibiscus cannabinus]
MGSVGEEDLAQMVRDFIESETPTSVSLASSKLLSLDHQSSLQEILGRYTDEEGNIHEKILKYLKDMGTAGHQNQTNSLKKLIVMKLRNDGFEASLCKTSWLTSTHHKVFRFAGGYEYIDVMVVENGGHRRVIVDMEFRSQFELARPSVRYKEMMSKTPLIFVGSEEKLKRIIPVLCSAAKTSLKEKGLHVPPWRKPAYMHSKWLSKNCKKVSVSPQDIGSADGDHHHLHKTEENKR